MAIIDRRDRHHWSRSGFSGGSISGDGSHNVAVRFTCAALESKPVFCELRELTFSDPDCVLPADTVAT